MREPTTAISVRMPVELWTKISELIDGKNFRDFSDAARSLIEAGLWLIEHKNELTNPEKSKKLIQEYNSKLNEKDLFEWVKHLPDSQIQGIEIAFEMEKEKRIKNL